MTVWKAWNGTFWSFFVFKATYKAIQGDSKNNHKLSSCYWKVCFDISQVDATSLLIILIFKLVIPSIKSFNWTFSLPVAERNLSYLSIVSDFHCMIWGIVFPNFEDKIAGVFRILRNTGVWIVGSFLEESGINAINICQVKSCQHVADCCIMGAVNVPLDFFFVGNDFLNISDWLIEKSSCCGSNLFLIWVKAYIHINCVDII